MPEPGIAPRGPASRAVSGARFGLAVLVGIAGAAVMVIELAGIRLLSPVFGNSLYTWTALIGVVLAAVSLGGHLGGRLADGPGAERALVAVLFAAAASTLAIAPLHALLGWSLSGEGMLLGPTMLSMLLFLLPGIGLGAVSPLATRLVSALEDDRRVGAAAGLVNMAGALGSLAGTFATGFLLIPHFGVRAILLGTAVVLLLLALLAARLCRTNLRDGAWLGSLVLAILLGARMLFVPAFSDAVVAHGSSRYQEIFVTEERDGDMTIRRLYHDRTQQGAMIMETGASPLPFQHYAALAGAYLDRVDRALVIGGGTFGIPRDIAELWPRAQVRTLEIDPAVVDIAERFFAFTPGEADHERITVMAQDARHWLNGDTARFDLVFGDAYNGRRRIPAHLVTREFFETLRERLRPGGVFMLNVIGATTGPQAALFAAIHRTLASVFPTVHVYRVYPERPDVMVNNLILVAGTVPARRPGHAAETGRDERLRALLATRVAPGTIDSGDAPVLTDDYNPVDWLVTRTLDAGS